MRKMLIYMLCGTMAILLATSSVDTPATELSEVGTVAITAQLAGPVVFEDTEIPFAGTEYVINSQKDWDDLIGGLTDTTNWTDSVYNGTDAIRLVLNCDIMATQDSLNVMQTGVSFTLDLNSHVFQSETGVFTFVTDDNNKYNTVNVEIKNGTIQSTRMVFGNSSYDCYSLVLTGVDFTACKTNALYAEGVPQLRIEDCTFTYDKEDNDGTDATAIDCSYARNGQPLTISDVTITDFYKGIYCNNSSSSDITIDNATITGAHNGVEACYVTPNFCVKNSNIVCDGTDGSYGVYFFGSNGSQLSSLLEGYTNVDNTSISHADVGVLEFASGVYVTNSTITDVNSACDTTGSGCFFVTNSTLKAKENPDTDSYGVRAGSEGVHLMNCTIEGFYVGAYCDFSYSQIANCVLDNIDTNINVNCGEVYNCELRNARIGILVDSTYTYVVDTFITGTDAEGSAGVKLNNAYYKMIGNDDPSNPNLGDCRYMSQILSYLQTNNMIEEYRTMEIQNYEKGIYAIKGSTNAKAENLIIHDCATGVDGAENSSLSFYNCEVYDCQDGIILSGLYTNGTLSVHDCTGDGIQVAKQVSTNSGYSGVDNIIEVYNCDDGIRFTGTNANASSSNYYKIHGNRGDGMQLSEGITFGSIGSFYNNGGWNINCLGQAKTLIFQNSSSFSHDMSLTNSNTKNVRLNAIGNARFSTSLLTSDDSIYYLEPNVICLGLVESEEWLNGTMTFDFEDTDYTVGRVIAAQVTSTKDNDLFVRSHFFAEKEGWMVKKVLTESSGYQLQLAEGCIVSYDYLTNGGTAFTGNYERLTYEKGTSIDLSPTAAKDGYEFVGWNTDPDATTGLTELTADTQNVTLYAIYSKDVNVTYHTYNGSFQDVVVFYNNEINKSAELIAYEGDNEYAFIGYTTDQDTAIAGTEDVLSVGDTADISVEGTDIYSVYSIDSNLTYNNADETKYDEDSVTGYYVTDKVLSPKFIFNLIQGPILKGFTFGGWKNADGTVYDVGAEYGTIALQNTLTAIQNQIYVTSLEVTPEEADVLTEETIRLTATVLPEDAYNTKVEWYSEDDSIAMVDENGLVTGISEGTVKIYAKTLDGSELSDYATITVNLPTIQVTYDYTTNGGTEFSGDDETVAVKKGFAIDLSPTAVKEGYEFAGWSLDADSSVVLDSADAYVAFEDVTEDTVLYAVFKKDVRLVYHTYNGTYEGDTVTFYNKCTELETELSPYQGDTTYNFVGYVIDKDTTVESTDDVLDAGESIAIGPEDMDIYCVYEQSNTLTYYHEDKIYDTDTQVKYYVAEDVLNTSFTYTLIDAPNRKGYSFTGWKDTNEQKYEEHSIYITTGDTSILTSDYKKIYVDSIEITPDEAKIYLGDKFQFSVIVLPEDAYDTSVRWYTEDEDVATVDQNGLVTSQGLGVTRVYAEALDGSGVSDYSVITVEVRKVESISVTPEKANIYPEETVQLYAEVLPENATYKDVIWYSEDEDIATVDDNGLVTGVMPGTVKVYAKATDGSGVTDYATITVDARKVTSISVTPEEAKIDPEETIQLSVEVLPENAHNKTVKWYSADESIAIVDESGLVTGVTPGTVKVYAETTDGSELSDYSVITVRNNRIVTVKGRLTMADGTPLANKEVSLTADSKAEVSVFSLRSVADTPLVTRTDEKGCFEFEQVPIGDYTFMVTDEGKLLAQCAVTVAALDDTATDNIAVLEKADNATVEYDIVQDIFTIDVDMSMFKEEPPTTTTDETTTTTTEEPPVTTETPTTSSIEEVPEETPATGDTVFPFIAGYGLVLAVSGLVFFRKK